MLIHQDPHCNLFWTYNGNNKDENNITKALINTFESMPNESVFKSLLGLLKIDGYDDNTDIIIEYALQRKPSEDVIKKFSEKDRYLWAISPTGRTWKQQDIPIEEIDFSDTKTSINNIVSIFENKYSYSKEEAIENANIVFDELKKCQENKGGSIPDGWIMVYTKGKIPLICIAIENKRYDLDPYQLKNHWVKSLFKSNNAEPKFNTYEEIYNILVNEKKENKNTVVKSFLEYLSLLGYEPFIDFWSTDFESHDDNPNFFKNIFREKFYKYFKKLMKNSKEFSSIYDENICDQMYLPNIRDFNLTFYIEDKYLSISTEVGVQGRDVNNKLIKELKRKNDLSLQINNIYKPVNAFFARFIRLLFVQRSMYYEINVFDNLNKYLDDIDENKISYWLSREEAVTTFDKLNVFKNNPTKVDFRNYKYKECHWLEYFRITTNINLEEYSNRDGLSHLDELDAKILSVIKAHCNGMTLLNKILADIK